ncbi:MAG: hypothetical protein ACD_20C00236G0002 [uncultured bacterium]|nr:MAG: hypothetical protein ACD_20C00236G0002 [uncultured bacterium]HBH19119.1 hypothetical protein [Cyanobacteria bacterium UBA9579]
MGKQESIIQRITGYHQLRTSLWAAQIVLIGGLAGLFLNLGKIPINILFVAGLFLESFIIYLINEISKDLGKLYTKLEEI